MSDSAWCDSAWCDSAWCSFIEQLSTNANRVFRGGIYGVIVYSGLIWKVIGHSASPRALLLPYQAFIHY